MNTVLTHSLFGIFAFFLSINTSSANCSRVEQHSGPVACDEGYVLVLVRTETIISYTAVCNYREPECQEANPDPCTPSWCWYEGCEELTTYYYECHAAPPPDNGGGDPPPNRPPTIWISQTPSGSYFTLGSGVSFNANVEDPDGDNVVVSWSGVSSSTGNGASLTISAPGEYTISATASDGRGGSATAWVTVYGFRVVIVQVTTPSPGYSFVSTDYISLQARVEGVPGFDSQIDWVVRDGGNNSGPGSPSTGQGASFGFAPNPPDAPGGRNAPLRYTITAQITLDARTSSDVFTIEQDNLDELRQEYIDLPNRVPLQRSSFDQETPAYSGLRGSAAEPGRHLWWILRNLNGYAQSTDHHYAGALNPTSGYRCPKGNAALSESGSAQTSNHQYGQAFDFVQADSYQNWLAFQAAVNAGAASDSYLRASNGIKYFLDNRNGFGSPTWPAPGGVAYTQGHVAW
jgi:hypothetical protein